MKKIWIVMILLLVFTIGCSSGGSSEPTQPTTETTQPDATNNTTTTLATDTTKTNETTSTINDTTNQPVTYQVVKSTRPASGDERVMPALSAIEVTFTEEIDPATVDSTTFYVTDGGKRIPGKISLSGSCLKAWFNPDTIAMYVPTGWSETVPANLKPSAYYKVTITNGVKTLWTQHSARAYSFGFYTEEDTKAPGAPGFTANGVTLNGKTANLTWTKGWDNYWIDGYKVYRNGNLITTIIGGDNTSYSDQNLAPSTTYGYSVSCIDASGKESTRSSIQWCTTLVN